MSLQLTSRTESENYASALAEAERRGLDPWAQVDRRKRFQATYGHDRVAFSHDCIDWSGTDGIKPHQERILALIDQNPRVCWRSPHEMGKSAVLTWALFHGLLTGGTDVKIPTTASAWRQLDEYLWPEVHKWARRIRWDVVKWRGPFDYGRELLTTMLKLSETCRAFAVACDDPASIEGAHADYLMQLFDESKTIPGATWDAAEGSHPDRWAAASTPGAPFGHFYDIHARKPGYLDWVVDRWTLEEGLECGMISEDWVNARREQWGESSPMFQNRVLGNFAAVDEEAMIPLQWVEAANERWLLWQREGALIVDGPRRIGVDPARSGMDKTAILERIDWLVPGLDYFAGRDTMEVAGLVVRRLNGNGSHALVDVIGIGAGVVDRLHELQKAVTGINVGCSTDRTDRSGEVGFTNLRACLWWAVRDWLDPANHSKVALPPDDKLTADLTSVRWSTTSSGKIRVEEKDQVKKRLGRSPDAGDALCLTFAPISIPAAMGSSDDDGNGRRRAEYQRPRMSMWH